MLPRISIKKHITARGRLRLSPLRAWALLLLVFSSCSNLRYLEEGQRLYTGSTVDIEAEEPLKEKSLLEDELEDVIRPVPNQTIFSWSPRLWFYNIAGEPSGKGLRHLLKNRLGRPPVLFDEMDAERSQRLMENRLFNMGYFDGQVSYTTRVKDKTASARFLVQVSPPYTINKLHPPQEGGEIVGQINAMLEESGLKLGAPYRLEDLKEERERIDKGLKEAGYFYFHPDYLIFLADTTPGQRTVDLRLMLKPDTPPEALKTYEMGNISVYADYMTDLERPTAGSDSLEVKDGLYIYDRQELFNPELFARSIFLEKGALYNIEKHDQSLGRIMGLNVFRFVNFRFSDPAAESADPTQLSDSLGTTQNPALDLRILLSPMKKKTLSAELRGVSKSNNFAGPGFTASLGNINLMGGAEQLRFSMEGAYETLIGSRTAPANSWEAGLETELIIPRFVAPFKTRSYSSRFVPKTIVSFGWNYFSRTDAFSLNSWRLKYGFNWNESYTTRHSLTPVLLNLFILGSVSEEFEELLASGLAQRRGLFEQFIIGSQYSWFHNSQLKPDTRNRNDVFLNVNFDFSGNLTFLAFEWLGKGSQHESGEYRVFDQSFSQFSKADIDFRYYRRMGSGQRLATRLIMGVGLPYGNSEQLPYVKLFTIGGVNSVRAFHPRSLGPGAYLPPDSLSGRFNPFQAGELKLEASLEYRFSFTRMVKGAVFVDAGNIWRLEEDENTPGGEFRWDRFYEQIALGTGAGIRFDATFFVLRLDFAFPLAVPYRDRDGFFEPIQPFKRSWRKDNLVLNLAIGYPF